MFVHLNCHSNYSFLAGASGIEDLVRAAGMGASALALTDTNGLYGAVAFHRAAGEAGIRPIFGTELTGRAVLLAKDLAGFGEICRVITACHLDPRFSLGERLAMLSDHVIVLCPDPEILDSIARKRGGQNLYAELTHFPDQRPLGFPCQKGGKRGGQNLYAEPTHVPDRDLIRFARRKRIPLVATNRVFFVRPEGWAVHRLLSAIRTRTTIHTVPGAETVSPQAWMKPPGEMARLFREVPDAIGNTLAIADRCDVTLPIGQASFPPFAAPGGETPSFHLGKLARAGLGRLYPRSVPAEAARRLRHELRVIDALGFAPYFLIVRDIVREARDRGIPTVGRGSAANSLVCRALDITAVDPMRHNLYFERFLNPERTDYPDIDIDFPWNRRDEMLDYVFEKYGRDRVALISAHIHFRGRSTLREVGKALGVPAGEIDAFTSRLPHAAAIARLDEVRRTVPECRGLPLEDAPYRSMAALAGRIEGFPRHVSIHCGGIVIAPFPITDRIPLQKTPKGFVVTQYDMYPVEDMGLLKIDLLAQKGLAVLADTVASVEANRGTRIDFDRTDPTRDPKTRARIRNGDTIGCFYIESPGMRNLLKKLDVCDFDQLTAASSIIRPGVADSGMMKAFIDRHNGREEVRYLHPKLEAVLKDTFGVMIYQEDVIKVAHVIAGMSLGEADSLRKCMSKKRDWEDINTYRERFLAGAAANGVEPGVALEIWRQIESFAGYAFCKAHSASFALVSYRTAYLKTHYPAEFMAAVLSNRGGFYDACAYAEEARRMGIRLLPPDVNQSADSFTVENSAGGPPPFDKARDDTACPAIRVGLSQVKGLEQKHIDRILEGRRDRPYASLGDFLSRTGVNGPGAEALIRCGALGGLGASRPEMLFLLKAFLRQRNIFPPPPPGAADALNGALVTGEPLRVSFELPEYDLREKLLAELEHLDLTVSGHLLALYDLRRKDLVAARELARFAGRTVTLAGWLITAKRTRTVKNELMKFLTLEDATAPFEVTLFPQVYRRFGLLLYDRGPYLVTGRVEREGRSVTLSARWLGRHNISG